MLAVFALLVGTVLCTSEHMGVYVTAAWQQLRVWRG